MARKIKTVLRRLFPRGAARVSAYVSLPFLIASWIVPFWRLSNLGDHIPLHYNVYFGVDYIGRWEYAIFLPAFATVAFIANFLVARAVRKESEALANTLTISAAGVSILILAGLFFILVINS